MPWQKAFLQLPCFSVWHHLIAMLMIKQRVSRQSTRMYFSNLVQAFFMGPKNDDQCFCTMRTKHSKLNYDGKRDRRSEGGRVLWAAP